MALPNIINEINTIKSTYYTTSGGYLKNGSAIWMGDDNTWKSLDLHSPSGGASLHLRGGNSPNQPYSFVLSTSYEYEDDRRKMLYGDNTGALIWAGNNVITSAGGTINGNLNVTGEIYSTNGNIVATNGNIKGVRIAAENGVNDNIDFIFPHITNGGAFLNGTDARNDEWHTIQTLKGWGVNGTTGYVKYSNGLIMQWGYIGSQNVTVTFPCSFSNANYTLVGGLVPGDPTKTYQQFNFKNFTSTSFYFQSYDYYTCKWLAVGF